mgnify:CR=1 FL=1|jgi:hypothetical protein
MKKDGRQKGLWNAMNPLSFSLVCMIFICCAIIFCDISTKKHEIQ